jgi:hypothetical protein
VDYLNLSASLSLPAPKTETASALKILKEVRGQRGAWADLTHAAWRDLPVLVARGQVDSIRIAGEQLCRDRVLSDPKGIQPRDRKLFPGPRGAAEWTQEVYFRLLDCGIRIPPSAGSASGASPNPVGYNRMYVHVDGRLSYEKWFGAFRAGRVTVTNGPLLRPMVHGQLPGHVFTVPGGVPAEFQIGLTLSTREPISYLEIIRNGQIYKTIPLDEYAKTGRLPPVRFDRGGWFLVRAVTDLPKNYRFAMTGPYYVEVDGQRRISRRAAQFFLDWVGELPGDQAAHDFWRDLLSKANAP